MLLSIVKHFEDLLLIQEYHPILKEFDEELHGWCEKYSHPFADEIGVDPEKKKAFLEDLEKARAKVKEMAEIDKKLVNVIPG